MTGRQLVNRHPALVAGVVFVAVVIPGFVRLETVADEADDTAAAAQTLAESNAELLIALCRVRNTGARDNTTTWTAALDKLGDLGADPRTVRSLRRIIPVAIPVDCDEDGNTRGDPDDYYP